jgi:cis-3-alkyl-4-acyloxetan-2-one decarboxylase
MATREHKQAQDYGGSGQVIVLLHGFLASSKYWMRMQPFLTNAGYRVITVDLLGFGDAPKPHSASYNYEDHIAYIDSVITMLKITQPFVLVGHSMGALLAARYGNVFPNRVSALILLHPPLYTTPHEARATLRNTGMLYRFLLDSNYRRIGWALIKGFAYTKIGKHSRHSRERSLQNVIEQAKVFSDLKRSATDTLLIVGLRDRAEYLQNVSDALLAESVTVIKENVTHHSPIEEPALIQRRILDFIS